jgi:oligoribonuclease NrnB/cAMP/cGMP phosphodiesterase (DHH superfamily)
MNKRKIGIIGHNDNDGRCASAIVYNYLKENEPTSNIICIEMDYDKECPLLSNIDELYIVDFSLKKDVLDRYIGWIGPHNITWIDHHESALKRLVGYEQLPGIRYIGKSGCLLTWEYLYPYEVVPEVVKYVNDADMYSMFYGDYTKGLYEYIVNNEEFEDPSSSYWKVLFMSDKLDGLIAEGLKLRHNKVKKMKKTLKDLSYPLTIEFNGNKYSCVKCNVTDTESISEIGEMIYTTGVQIAWMYYDKLNENGDLLRVNSLRSNSVDVSEIAMSKGGGGHKFAAGFTEILAKKDVYNVVVM